MESKDILDYYRIRNADFLHANGESGTIALISSIQFQGNERVFEFGCGTGGTLVKLSNQFPQIKLTATDLNPKMMEKAAARLRFCGLNNRVSFVESDKLQNITQNSFDIIVVESVLAIQTTAR